MVPRDRPEIERRIEEIVYEVEAGQTAPWTATKQLITLFRRGQILNRVVKGKNALAQDGAIR